MSEQHHLATMRRSIARGMRAGQYALALSLCITGPVQAEMVLLTATNNNGDRDSRPGLQVNEGDEVTFRIEITERTILVHQIKFSLIGRAANTSDLGTIRRSGSTTGSVSGIPRMDITVSGTTSGYIQNYHVPITSDSTAESDKVLTGRVDELLDNHLGTADFSSVSLPSVTVTIRGDVDYDTNNNGLIEIRTLAQLNAIRHDLNGDGMQGTVSDSNWANYTRAFSSAATGMGCQLTDHDDDTSTPNQATCTGYELMNDLDFDENGNGDRDDTYNQGDGWLPLGDGVSTVFATTFNGNGYVIHNLYINRGSTNFVGLLGDATSPRIENLGLVDVDVTGGNETGGLLGGFGGSSSSITAVYVTGQVSGGNNVGGLVGSKRNGAITACYARVRVNGAQTVGGLIGADSLGSITASYTLGRVSGTSSVSAFRSGSGTVTASYWDTETSDIADDTDDNAPEGKTTAELQTPTDYTGIYANWNVNVDGVTGNDNPWAFGEDYQYPVLRHGRTQAQIQAQFEAQPLRPSSTGADVNQDGRLNEQDALLMYQTYLPGVRGAGVVADVRERATAWQESGRAVGGDLNGDGRITEQDALIMVYAYQFRALLENHAALRQLLLNGVRGQMPDTDATYRELLRRANRLR